jgi:signal transduction histidine kinase
MILWAMDKDGKYILQSPKSIEYWGNHIGQTVLESSPPRPERDDYIAAIQRAMNGEVVNKETIELIYGEPRNFFEMVAPIRVGDRIDGLVGLSLDITDQKRAADMLLRLNEELERRVGQRTNELGLANQALSESLEALKEAQDHLVQSEKMAALGGLVAGIAHEINTPLGIGVTAASYLEHKVGVFSHQVDIGEMNQDTVGSFVESALECSNMILANLKRAGDLVESFKQVAVDQTSEKRRMFYLCDYLEEVLLSLRPRLKHTDHKVLLDCPRNLQLDGYPGAYSQIITNLIMNSLIHAFDGIDNGIIRICVHSDDKQVILVYSDDGIGMDDSTRRRVFEPFFTTKRGQGGSGLGLHIVFNLVSQTLGGRIECSSIPGEGTQFTISVPIEGSNNDVKEDNHTP